MINDLRNRARGLIVVGALLAAAGSAAAQDRLQIEATVDRAEATLDEQIVLTVTVSGKSSPPPVRLPSLPNFNVYGSGHSTSMSLINGRIASSAQHNFILVPRMIGKAVIPEITVSAGGESASTRPIEVTIHRSAAVAPAPQPAPRPQTPSAQPAAPGGSARDQSVGPDLFVTAEVDKKEPFVNEQVLLTVKFYTGVPLVGNAEWTPPETRGFLAEALPPGDAQKTQARGRVYYVNEIKTALFPLEAGKLGVGPATIRCQVQPRMEVDPFAPDFFQRFFSGGLMAPEGRELKTRELALSARALPAAGKPPEFDGAVGEYRISAKADLAEVKAGDAVNLSVTIEGKGNLKALGELKLPEMPSFRLYETVSDLNLAKGAAGLSGAKTYKTVIVPREAGDREIPAIRFAFFDPEKRGYRTVATKPLALKVLPGAQQTPPVGFAAAGKPAAEITRVTADIRHIKDEHGEPALAAAAAAFVGLLWLHLFPSAAFLASLGVSLHRSRLASDPPRARARAALARARAKIRDSRAERDPRRSAGLLADALSGFLGDKLGRSPHGLTLAEIRDGLRARYPALPAGHLERLKALWEELDLQRFAPASAKDGDTAHQLLGEGVRELVEALEEDLR